MIQQPLNHTSTVASCCKPTHTHTHWLELMLSPCLIWLLSECDPSTCFCTLNVLFHPPLGSASALHHPPSGAPPGLHLQLEKLLRNSVPTVTHSLTLKRWQLPTENALQHQRLIIAEQILYRGLGIISITHHTFMLLNMVI